MREGPIELLPIRSVFLVLPTWPPCAILIPSALYSFRPNLCRLLSEPDRKPHGCLYRVDPPRCCASRNSR